MAHNRQRAQGFIVTQQFTESQLLSFIIKRCWHEREWLTIDRANSGRVKVVSPAGKSYWITLHKEGTPDLIGYFGPAGRFIGLEAKVGKNYQSEEQIEFEFDCRKKGAYYKVIRSPEDLEKVIEEIRP